MNYEDRIYQSRAVDWLCKTRQGIVESPAGSGKTVIASTALARVTLSRERSVKVRVGWVAHTIEQCEQAVIALDQFPEAKKFMDIKIACAAAEIDWSDRDVLIVDECQWAATPHWRNQIEKCKGARWGFSATPWFENDSERNEQLYELFGRKLFRIDRADVKSNLAEAKVVILDESNQGIEDVINASWKALYRKRRARFKHVIRKILGKGRQWRRAVDFWKQKKWQLVMQAKWTVIMKIGIEENGLRNDSVVEKAISHSQDHVLILVNCIRHGEELRKRIDGSMMCFSKMGRKKRAHAISAFKSGELKCLIATSLADEGLDVPIANVLILVCAGRAQGKVIQRSGRVLRKTEGKDSAIIYDFADNYHPMAANHFKKRLSIYRKLGYTIL